MADKNIQLMSENGVDNLFPATKRFADTSNLLASWSKSAYNYTATEDCWVFLDKVNGAVTINGVKVLKEFGYGYNFPLKKGQNIEITADTNNGTNRIFGLI